MKPLTFTTLIIFSLVSSSVFSQSVVLTVGKGAWFSGGDNAYTVIAGDIKNDGNIYTPNSNLKITGSAQQQHITCYSQSGSFCPNIYNTSVYNTVFGNVDQQNPNGIIIETNTLVNGTHIFTAGSTEIREGNYFLYNSVTPFSNNSSTKFFVTPDSYHGLLKQKNVSAAVLFPVGTATSDYTPATITYAGAPDSFGVRVMNNVYHSYNVLNGDPLAGASSVTNTGFVKKTWIVNKGTIVTSGFATAGFTATVQWNANNENIYFTPHRKSDITVVRNHDILWLPASTHQGPATNPFGAGPYSKTDPVTYDNAFYPYYPITVSVINHILPVIGLNLTANLNGKNTQLKWTTVTESNTKYFDVERSSDGVSFTSIRQVAASGNSSIARYYSCIDSSATASINYYRIKAVDKDGKFIFSNIISIKNSQPTKDIMVLSSPSAKNIDVLFKNVAGNYTISLFDNSGAKIREEKIKDISGSYKHSMSTGVIKPGIYYLRIYNNQTKEITTINVFLNS